MTQCSNQGHADSHAMRMRSEVQRTREFIPNGHEDAAVAVHLGIEVREAAPVAAVEQQPQF